MYSMYTGSTQGGFKSQVELSFLLYFFPPGRKEIQPRFKEILENLKSSSNMWVGRGNPWWKLKTQSLLHALWH